MTAAPPPDTALLPWRVTADDPSIGAIHALLHESFAYMEGRIDPPSSLHRLSASGIAAQCGAGEVWVIGRPPVACMFLTPKPDCLYLGKIAVAASRRAAGMCRTLVVVAAERAAALGLDVLELETRIELVENHRAFERLGFVRTGENAHPGFDRPTSITMRRRLGQDGGALPADLARHLR